MVRVHSRSLEMTPFDSAPPDSLAEFKGPTSKGRREMRRGGEEEGKGNGEGKG